MASATHCEGSRVRLAYLTSMRWVDTLGGSIVERLAREIVRGESAFAKRFELVAIVADDDDHQAAAALKRSAIWPADLAVPVTSPTASVRREKLAAMTRRIPSQPWKNLRRQAAESERRFRQRTAQAKSRYEGEIIAFLRQRRAELILVDSYLTIVGPDLLAAFPGRILNVHPSITAPGDPSRLPGRTPTRDTFTRAAFGYIITDDKRSDLPTGPRIVVTFDDQLREAVFVGCDRRTGVTVHQVTEEVDGGPVVDEVRYELSDADIDPVVIRTRNCRIKAELVPRALLRHSIRLGLLSEPIATV